MWVGVATAVLLAQIQIGEIRGRVSDPSGAAIAGARVELYDTAGFEFRVSTGPTGSYTFPNVPYGFYRIRAESPGFRAFVGTVTVDSNLRVDLPIQLSIAATDETLTVRSETPLLQSDRVARATRLDQNTMERIPGGPANSVQRLAATVAGWSTEDNGLLHTRGVDDGFLYVSNGVPLVDRVDTFFSSALDINGFASVEILDGHIPVEYGYVSGGVINVVPRSGLGRTFSGTFSARVGSEQTRDGSGTFGGSLRDSIGLFASGYVGGSGERFLDPVDPDSFNNSGSSWRFHSRIDWRASQRDLFVADVSANGSSFRVTNTFDQEEQGQRQRQELGDNHQSLIWQRSWSEHTVTDVSWYRRSFSAELRGSENDTPISAQQDRTHQRTGVLWNLTHAAGRHLLKLGGELQRVTPRETFVFFVTEEDEAEDAGVSDAVLRFSAEAPFLFEDAATRGQGSFFVQDTFSAGSRVTVDVGIRLDATDVLVRESAISPRVGAVYSFEDWGATIRGSYNRLFKPPQVENLLLSSSEQARRLSPFVSPFSGLDSGSETELDSEVAGGAEVRPERQNAFEIGLSKTLGAWGLLDVAYWQRHFRNQADPNVFFGTTIVFPNAVAEGKASGVNLRIEVPFRRGFSGFLSYGNAVVFQRGPINGGLFLEDGIIEIGPGTRFTPDHDQRNVGSFGLTFEHSTGAWFAIYGRHESGTPFEVDEDDLDEIFERRGAELVDFDRLRVKPRTLFDVSVGTVLWRDRSASLDLQLDVRNLMNESFAYNFSNPFSGTHFGHPRLVSFRMKLTFPSS